MKTPKVPYKDLATALALCARQRNLETRKSLTRPERDLLARVWVVLEDRASVFGERWMKARQPHKVSQYEMEMQQAARTSDEIRRVLEEDQPPMGYMQGRGAS